MPQKCMHANSGTSSQGHSMQSVDREGSEFATCYELVL